MSLFPFCVCKACRKWETWVSTIGRQEKEAGKLILHKLGKGHCKMLSICHTQLAACFQGAEEKGLCFYVRSVLYLIPPHRWRLRENLMAELREWAFVNVQNSSIRSTFCLRVPFLFAQFHLHYKPIHIFWFTSLHALLIQFNLEVVLRLACVHECDSNCRKYLLFLTGATSSLSEEQSSHVKESSDWQTFHRRLIGFGECYLQPCHVKSVCRAALRAVRWTVDGDGSVFHGQTSLLSWFCLHSSAKLRT